MNADRLIMLFGSPVDSSALLERPRVDDLFAEVPVTLVLGDHGSGKTAAVAAWARAEDLLGVWVDATGANRDAERFWSTFASLLEAQASVPSTPSTGRVTPKEFVQRTLLRAPWPFTIVVDGVDDLGPATVDDIVGLGYEAAVRLVLIGRVAPPAVSLADTSRSVAVVSADQLALTFDEIAELLRAAGVVASPGAASFLHAATGGLPLVAAVVARALGGQRVAGERLSALQANLVVEAVERAVIPRNGPAPGISMLRTIRAASLLIDTTVAELALLAEIPEAAARVALGEAERSGWGCWVDGDRDHFALAPSIARALAFRVLVKRSASLLARAARALSERGEGMRALMLAFDAEDDELILRVGSRHLGAVLAHHRQILVRLERIPRLRVTEHPLIAFATAACQAQDPRNRVAALANWVRAERLSRSGAARGRAVDRVVLLIGRSVAFNALGRFPWAASAAESAVRLMEELSPTESTQLLVSPGVVYGQAAAARFASGDVRDARHASGRAVGVHAASSLVRHHELSRASLFASVDGDLAAARTHLDAARLRPTVDGFVLRALPDLAEALIVLERGDAPAARRLIGAIGPHIRTESLWAIAECVSAVADLIEGRNDAAVMRLQAALAAEGNAPLSRPLRSAVGSLLALGYLASGEAGRVRSLTGSLGRTGGAFVANSATALAVGDELAALMEATTGLSVVRTIRVRTSLLLIRAAAASRLGRTIAADRDTTGAFASMRHHDVWTPWLVLGNENRLDLLDRAEQRGMMTPQVRSSLRGMPLVITGVGAVPRLTAREHAVLVGVFARETNADIASRLGISPNTVKKQRAGLYRKLGVNTWEDAVTTAVDLGLLDVVH